MKPLKLLIVDHHAIHLPGRMLYHELAKTKGYALKVMVPRVWKEQGITYRYAPADRIKPESERSAGLGTMNVVPSRLLFGGKTHRNIYLRLSRELLSFRPDVLLVNSEPEGFLAFQATLLCTLFRLRASVLFTTWRNMHYGEPGAPFPVKWTWLCRLIERYVLPRTAHGIAHSPSAVRIFQSRGFDRISYTPPWVDVHRFAGAPRPQYSTRPLRIGYVGRLVREKGVDVLIRALQGAEFPFSLVVVGDGPEKEQLQDLVRESGIVEQCSFLLPVQQHEIPDIMRRLDILVLPSRKRPGWKEQFGRVLIEAMAGGAVVVGSDSGDIPNVIGDAGFVFKEEDWRDLRSILQRLATDRNLIQTYRDAGLQRVTQEYSLSITVDRYRALFDALKFKREIRTIEKGPSKPSQA